MLGSLFTLEMVATLTKKPIYVGTCEAS